MALTTAQTQGIQRDITATFRKTAMDVPTLYQDLCTIVPSTSDDEKYGWAGDVPGMTEWVGERQLKQLRAANYVLANKTWES